MSRKGIVFVKSNSTTNKSEKGILWAYSLEIKNIDRKRSNTTFSKNRKLVTGFCPMNATKKASTENALWILFSFTVEAKIHYRIVQLFH